MFTAYCDAASMEVRTAELKTPGAASWRGLKMDRKAAANALTAGIPSTRFASWCQVIPCRWIMRDLDAHVNLFGAPGLFACSRELELPRNESLGRRYPAPISSPVHLFTMWANHIIRVDRSGFTRSVVLYSKTNTSARGSGQGHHADACTWD